MKISKPIFYITLLISTFLLSGCGTTDKNINNDCDIATDHYWYKDIDIPTFKIDEIINYDIALDKFSGAYIYSVPGTGGSLPEGITHRFYYKNSNGQRVDLNAEGDWGFSNEHSAPIIYLHLEGSLSNEFESKVVITTFAHWHLDPCSNPDKAYRFDLKISNTSNHVSYLR